MFGFLSPYPLETQLLLFCWWEHFSEAMPPPPRAAAHPVGRRVRVGRPVPAGPCTTAVTALSLRPWVNSSGRFTHRLRPCTPAWGSPACRAGACAACPACQCEQRPSEADGCNLWLQGLAGSCTPTRHSPWTVAAPKSQKSEEGSDKADGEGKGRGRDPISEPFKGAIDISAWAVRSSPKTRRLRGGERKLSTSPACNLRIIVCITGLLEAEERQRAGSKSHSETGEKPGRMSYTVRLQIHPCKTTFVF